MGSSSSIDALAPVDLKYVSVPLRPPRPSTATATSQVTDSTTSNLMNIVVLQPDDVPGAILKSKPADSTVAQLTRWLGCRGLNKQGKKAELVERVTQAMTLDLPIDSRIDGGIPYKTKCSQKVSIDHLVQSDGEALSIILADAPVTGFPSSGWATFPSRDIPEMFNHGSILVYIIESLNNIMATDYDDDTQSQLKKGIALKNSGFVHNVTDNQQGTFYYLSGHVHRSMVMETQHVMVALSMASGSIQKAQCGGCVVQDLARCCHIAALLIYLRDHVVACGYKLDTSTSSLLPCTSQPCTWNKGSKRKKNPKPLHLVDYPTKRKNTAG